MWECVQKYFKKYPAQEKVAKALINLGLSVKNSKIYCKDIEIASTALARALSVDRRTVSSTIETIASDTKLAEIFKMLEPTCTLKNVAPVMGWDMLEIVLSNTKKPGLLGKIASELGRHNVNIRQAIGEDPQWSRGRLYIITDTKIPGNAILAIREIDGVENIII
ncbi:MAG: amino acid-binding ACT domain protein [Candidatus Thermoplasmatota archaeon]|nr:amino acid-binding ACT domain protein [Candidatus Thermoplasmatota archaeon]MDI6887028.1 amino acid-binding ACT domain protein [Candidatus Thermoplasmatota archaeon]